jgi:hypothetical protein
MERCDSLPSGCVYVCVYCGGFRRSFLDDDEFAGEEVDYGTNYSSDRGECQFSGKFAPVVITSQRTRLAGGR